MPDIVRAFRPIAQKTGKNFSELAAEAQRLLAAHYGVDVAPMRSDIRNVSASPDHEEPLATSPSGALASDNVVDHQSRFATPVCGHRDVASLLGISSNADLGLPPMPDLPNLCADCRAIVRERSRRRRARSKKLRELALKRLEALPKTMLPKSDVRISELIDRVAANLLGSRHLAAANDANLGAVITWSEGAAASDSVEGMPSVADPSGANAKTPGTPLADRRPVLRLSVDDGSWQHAARQQVLESLARLPRAAPPPTLREELANIGRRASLVTGVVGVPLTAALAWAPWLAVVIVCFVMMGVLVEIWLAVTGHPSVVVRLTSRRRPRGPPDD